MAISDIPVLSMLKSRLQWHEQRQRVLAENVSKSDMPGFRARDLAPLSFDRQLQPAGQATLVSLQQTSSAHIAGSNSAGAFRAEKTGNYEVRPTGNAVSLEDEMLKVSSNQMDYQAATALYTRSLALLKTALGKR